MGNTALLVLERKITEYQVDIENLKIKIADCAIKAHSTPPQEVNVIFDNLHQMAKLIDEVKPKEVMLSELFKTKHTENIINNICYIAFELNKLKQINMDDIRFVSGQDFTTLISNTQE